MTAGWQCQPGTESCPEHGLGKERRGDGGGGEMGKVGEGHVGPVSI